MIIVCDIFKVHQGTVYSHKSQFMVQSIILLFVCFDHYDVRCCLSWPGHPCERGLDLNGLFIWLNKGYKKNLKK